MRIFCQKKIPPQKFGGTFHRNHEISNSAGGFVYAINGIEKDIFCGFISRYNQYLYNNKTYVEIRERGHWGALGGSIRRAPLQPDIMIDLLDNSSFESEDRTGNLKLTGSIEKETTSITTFIFEG